MLRVLHRTGVILLAGPLHAFRGILGLRKQPKPRFQNRLAGIHEVGMSSSGLLFLTLPTAEPTFQAFICSAGNGFNKSIGNCDGSAGANHL